MLASTYINDRKSITTGTMSRITPSKTLTKSAINRTVSRIIPTSARNAALLRFMLVV